MVPYYGSALCFHFIAMLYGSALWFHFIAMLYGYAFFHLIFLRLFRFLSDSVHLLKGKHTFLFISSISLTATFTP